MHGMQLMMRVFLRFINPLDAMGIEGIRKERAVLGVVDLFALPSLYLATKLRMLLISNSYIAS